MRQDRASRERELNSDLLYKGPVVAGSAAASFAIAMNKSRSTKRQRTSMNLPVRLIDGSRSICHRCRWPGG